MNGVPSARCWPACMRCAYATAARVRRWPAANVGMVPAGGTGVECTPSAQTANGRSRRRLRWPGLLLRDRSCTAGDELVQVPLPVVRHLSGRAWRGLTERVVMGRAQRRTLDRLLRAVV